MIIYGIDLVDGADMTLAKYSTAANNWTAMTANAAVGTANG